MELEIVKLEKKRVFKLILVLYVIPSIYLGLYLLFKYTIEIPIALFALLFLIIFIFAGIYVSTTNTHSIVGKLQLYSDRVIIERKCEFITIRFDEITKFHILYSGYKGEFKWFSLSFWKGGYGTEYRGSGNIFKIETNDKKLRLNCILYNQRSKSILKDYISNLKIKNMQANVKFKKVYF